MIAPYGDTTTDLHAVIAELRAEHDAGLAREAALAKSLAQRNSQYSERIEHQAATIDVLKAMSASPGDAQPVFDLIVRRARELCNGEGAGLLEFDGTLVHSRAWYGQEQTDIRTYSSLFPMPPSRASIACRAIMEGQIIHIRDAHEEPELLRVVRDSGLRSLLALPLLHDGKAIGAIALNALDAGGFTDSQIALLQTFAEQAVIAITSAETYRALQTRTSDLQETLEYQTATSEVLKVISRSTFDLQPVLDTVVETAAKLCVADMAHIGRREGEVMHFAANYGFSPEYETYLKARGSLKLDPGSPTIAHRTLIEGHLVHIDDVTAVPGYPEVFLRLGKHRTSLGVPLLRDGETIGFIQLSRQRVEPFTDRQIELVSTFADQAVIAIENTRLITEQREALEQQTATAEVLQVINASPGDLAPVFDAMLDRAMRLCDGAQGTLWMFDGERMYASATAGYSSELAEQLGEWRAIHPFQRRLLLGERVFQIVDLAAEELYRSGNPLTRAAVDIAGIRTVAFVALVKDTTTLGGFTIGRREVRAFTDKHIALLQNFAEQAVIAMENARLITEQREALEQQTATAEMLQVINANPGNLVPVFEAILEKAHALCGVAHGALVLREGETFRAVATHSYAAEFADQLRRGYRGLDNPISRSLIEGIPFLHIADLTQIDDPMVHASVEVGGVRTGVFVPLRRDNQLLGLISSCRREVRPFSDKEIALLQNFAAQAVIAIENARLITETREALERQTATAEVLGVINSSPGNLPPVFDAMLEKAMRLCEAAFGVLWTLDGDAYRAAALRGVTPEFAEYVVTQRRRPEPDTALGQLASGESFVHVADVASRRTTSAIARKLEELGSIRTLLAVPLRREQEVLGAFHIYRQEVRPFSDKQIALLQNFAAQAVIAMENARLLTETREALEQQTATAEVLQVINSNPGNLAPVFDAMLEKAHGLCGIAMGSLELYDGQCFRAVAVRGLSDAFADMLRQGYPASENPATGPLIDGGRLTHIRDLAETDYAITRSGAELDAARTLLCVPLRREGTLLGMIASSRREVRPFSDKEIALLENFAAQAVIAMENARLLTEQREALQRQTATAEVLQVINASPGNLAPVFDAMLEKAMRLCGGTIGGIFTFDGDHSVTSAVRGVTAAFQEYNDKYPMDKIEPGTVPARVIETRGPVQTPDLTVSERYRAGHPYARALVQLGAIRAVLAVPLLKDDVAIGMVAIYRQEPGAFTDKQIALLENFAAQAVIAMENARLLTEQREALEQQTGTAEVLQVINGNPGDLAPVFDAVLEKAIRLCSSAFGTLHTYDGQIMRVVATRGLTPEQEMLLVDRPPATGQPTGRIAGGEDVVHLLDAREQDGYHAEFGPTRSFVDQVGARTAMWVALRKDKELLGILTIFRREVRAFTGKEVELVQSFAAQAVIAMENARLITEQREALEQQTAMTEVLQVINTSPGNLAPVFDAILEKAHLLCDASRGTLFLFDGEAFRAAASHGYPGGLPERMVHGIAVSEDPRLAALLAGEHFIHVPDLRQLQDPIARAVAERGGVRTNLLLPLRRNEHLLGVLSCNRAKVQPFTDKEIALLQTFAAQAVIAMENARLLDEIRRRQEELRVTFENMGDGVALFDETHHLVASNRRFRDMLDVPDYVISARPAFADYIRYLADHGEYGPDAEDQVQRLLTSGGQPTVFERTRPNGRVIEVRSNPVLGGGFVVIYSDITERKRSEEELRAARDAAEKASRTIEAAYRDLKAAQASLIQAEKMASLGQLTAGIAHEIKNPLNFVNNFAALSVDLLGELKDAIAPAETALTEKQRAEVEEVSVLLTSNLEKITEHGKRADGIVKAMLEHSRGSSGERRMVDLNALIDGALNLAYHGARAQDQTFNITLERDFGEGIAPIEVNPQDITRVFLNIFSNGFYAATRRTREGGDTGFEPTLRVTTRDAGEAVEIRVRDNGTGIPADIRDKLFQPFFTTKPTGEGTGLGLSITYDIVTQQHGGDISVDSKVGDYSEFTIRLPRSRL